MNKNSEFYDIYDQTNEFVEAYEAACNMSCLPDPYKFPKYKEGDVIDENKSVKWNREEVAKRIQARNDEVARLNTVKNKRIVELKNMAVDTIARGLINDKLVANVGRAYEIAGNIWNRAYDDGHAYGMPNVVNYIYKYVEFAEELLKK